MFYLVTFLPREEREIGQPNYPIQGYQPQIQKIIESVWNLFFKTNPIFYSLPETVFIIRLS